MVTPRAASSTPFPPGVVSLLAPNLGAMRPKLARTLAVTPVTV